MSQNTEEGDAEIWSNLKDVELDPPCLAKSELGEEQADSADWQFPPDSCESAPPVYMAAAPGKVAIDAHLCDVAVVAERLRTHINPENPGDSKGLSEEYAGELLRTSGANVLSPIRGQSKFRLFLSDLLSPFNVIIIIAGILQCIMLAIDFEEHKSTIYLGPVFILLAIINALINFVQKLQAAATMAGFLKMVPSEASVIRDGQARSINTADLVAGDIVKIRSGDQIPADLLLFHSTGLEVDNSALTGEIEPQERYPGIQTGAWNEATNLVFSSTLCVSGEGFGIVIGTGDATAMGTIAGLAANEKGTSSLLSTEITRFCHLIAFLAVVTALIFLGISLKMYPRQTGTSILFAVSIIIAWVPEGAPATVTLLLLIAARKMAAQQVLIKDLQGVETLGALTLLLTDKTGTLTKNNDMAARYVWTGQRMLAVCSSDESDSIPRLELSAAGAEPMLECATLCSRLEFDTVEKPIAERVISGDATEKGIACFVAKYRSDHDMLRRQCPKVFEIPFNSSNKWQMSIHQKVHSEGTLTLYLKGAPEKVLTLCSHFIDRDGSCIALDRDFSRGYQENYETLVRKGHRVLAMAQCNLPTQYSVSTNFVKRDLNWPQDGYTFLGLISLEDPPKEDVKEAVRELRGAGIRVMMVTGDHARTAESIARQTGLVRSETMLETLHSRDQKDFWEMVEHSECALAIHGTEIDQLTERQWDIILSKEEIVFARTTPVNKLEITKRAQERGHIVGMTGDGVNDSPALKRADIGIAMNLTGSDASKSVANMVLLDDKFSSIVTGVRQGRTIFANLKRSLTYTLCHIIPEVIPIILNVIVPIPLPLSAILVVVIDLGFEMFIAITFAWDEAVPHTMQLPPRRSVTASTIHSYRRGMELDGLTRSEKDLESAESRSSSGSRCAMDKLRRPFQRSFWRSQREKNRGETLVDLKSLSYVFEIGILSTCSVLLCYFLMFYQSAGLTPSELRRFQREGIYFKAKSPDIVTSAGRILTAQHQADTFAIAKSLAYLSIFITQTFNIFAIKIATEHSWPFTRRNVSNLWSFVGIWGGAILAFLIVYIPPLRVVFGTSHQLSPLYWLIPITFGIIILIYATLRRLVLGLFHRKHVSPEGSIAAVP